MYLMYTRWYIIYMCIYMHIYLKLKEMNTKRIEPIGGLRRDSVKESKMKDAQRKQTACGMFRYSPGAIHESAVTKLV